MTIRPGEEVIVELSSEQLAISKRVIETGRLSIRVATSVSATSVSEQLVSETAEVERTPIGRFVDNPPQVREEGDVLVVPIVEERLVKRLFLREELRISRRRETKAFSATADLRREEAVIERTNPEPLGFPTPSQPLSQEEPR